MEIHLPASKSLSNRALIIAHLAHCTDRLTNIAQCDDTRVMLNALHNIAHQETIHTIDVENAGTAMRFLTALLAQKDGDYVLKGSDRMHHRPIGILVNALKELGGELSYLEKEGFPPLRIKGKKLRGGKIEVKGGISSQFISALLMIAPLMEKGLELHITPPLVSAPYIQMTLNLMHHFGVQTQWKENTILVPPQHYSPTAYEVENDWSAASYWYAASALSLSEPIVLKGLEKDSWQGDSRAAMLFERLGVKSDFLEKEKGVVLRQVPLQISHLDYDFSEMPDLVQTFLPLCCLLGVKFRFSGLQTLRIKETDRMEALMNECRKLGFVVSEPCPNVLEWKGERVEPTYPIEISTYNDHRMAMGFAPFLLLGKSITMEKPEVVKKSYPNFWEEWKKIKKK